MDLKYEGRPDLARVLADGYFAASGDDEGRALVPFYISYRAAVRGKVEGFKQAEAEVPAADRAESLAKARGYWLLALGELEPPEARPCLLLVGGLPGSGKSTLAAELERSAGFRVIRSDLVRKDLAAAAGIDSGPDAFGAGIYSADWNDRTYTECLRRAEALLFEGERVLVDASFREEARRRALLEAAARWRVPALLLVCQADPQVIRARLAARKGDASDADWSIYLEAAKVWQQPGPATERAVQTIATSGTREQSLAQALAALRASGLAR
jgi:predicted kinase